MVEGDYNYPITRAFSVRVQGGPHLVIDTPIEDETNTNVGARYLAQGWYTNRQFMAGAGLVGITNFTAEAAELEGIGRTDLAVGGSLIANFAGYQPGINFQVPVTNTYSSLVDWVVGVSMRVPF